ncbi:MAG: hypothetical protein WC593_09155 [Methanoregula sp.]
MSIMLPLPPHGHSNRDKRLSEQWKIGFLLKILFFNIMMGVETPIPSYMMNSAAPEGAPPRRISDKKY